MFLRRQRQMRRRILLAIDELGPGRSSLTIRRHLEAQGDVNFGLLYYVLGRLVEEGLVISEKRRGGPERRYDHEAWWAYSLTYKGKVEIAEPAERRIVL